MISSKHITAIVSVIVTVAVILCLCGFAYAGELTEALGGTGVTMEYETELFDTDKIISVDIKMDAEQWNEMLDNATSEVYYQCDVIVNGKTFYSVGIRPKGNTSLSAIAMDADNDRYSFKLEFDQYIDGQTCFGLDKLILNNNYADATNMKEAVIYDMYQYLGADASLYNYAEISMNGSYWGVYLAVEAVEDSFLLRNYGVGNGNLYKPDSMNIGGDMGNDDSSSGQPDTGKRSMNFGGFSLGGGGANLEYTDDDLDSYSTIWDGAVTDSSDSDHKRVVTALKNISEGNEIEKSLDVDNILKYMAVHSFAVNDDSLSGNMAHNYYLYEYNGQLNILPWDYNLSFGGMSANGVSGASSVINDPIDTPFSGTTFFDVLLENEEYMAKYHEYYQQLAEKYVDGGEFDSFYNNLRSQIDELVETDLNAMYTYEEYTAATAMLYNTVKLRAESIKGQLDGTIPSTTTGQRSNSAALVDASSIDISAMGTFSMGGGSGFNNIGEKNRELKSDDTDASQLNATTPEDLEVTQLGSMPEDFDPSQFDGSMPEGFDPSQFGGKKPDGFDSSQFGGSMPSGFQTGSGLGTSGNIIWIIISAVVVTAGIVFACLYKRNSRR